MFNQERGAGEKRRLWPAPTRRARPQQRAPGRAKWLRRLGGSPRTRVGLKWEDGGFLPPPSRQRGEDWVCQLSLFGFVKCSRLSVYASLMQKEKKE